MTEDCLAFLRTGVLSDGAEQMLVARGRYSEALTTFDDLLELDPSNLLGEC